MPLPPQFCSETIAAPWGSIVLTACEDALWEVSFRLEPAPQDSAVHNAILSPWITAIRASLQTGQSLGKTSLQALLTGKRMRSLSPFCQTVLRYTTCIACGTFLTYGTLAALLGRPQAARAVGQALASNPFPILIPCHRVISARMNRHWDEQNAQALQGIAFGGKKEWAGIAAWLRMNDIAHAK